jgi:hypothetical protein
MGIKIAASTVWEILEEHGIPPAPKRQNSTWPNLLCGQADALLACDFFETSKPGRGPPVRLRRHLRPDD